MIKVESGTKERIEAIAKSQKADKILVEKVVRALMLLEGLAKSDLDFIFKGLCVVTHNPFCTKPSVVQLFHQPIVE